LIEHPGESAGVFRFIKAKLAFPLPLKRPVSSGDPASISLTWLAIPYQM
jgi:hypothetical protein